MDVAGLSTVMSSSELLSQVSVKVLSMGLDNLETAGEGMRKIMEMSVTPSVGGNIDISL
ncbi:MAG: YjfB family protein [Butyrivibrio sp.]